MRFTLVLLLCLLPRLAVAQSAPDRAGEVDTIVRAHPEFFGSDDARRDGLKVIVCALNTHDGGNWGRLVKLDQGGKIPADHIVWRPTREHFDVLTDTGPMWGNSGVLTNPQWQWSAVDCGNTPAPVDPPAPPNLEPVYAALKDLSVQIGVLNARIAEEAATRESETDALGVRIFELEKRVIPIRCVVKAFGLRLGCALE